MANKTEGLNGMSLAGFGDDLMEFGVMAASATAGLMGWSYVVGNQTVNDLLGKVLPESVKPYALPALQIAAGVVAANALTSVDRRVAVGAGVGLVAGGIVGLGNAVLGERTFSLGALGTAPIEVAQLGRPPVEIEQLGDLAYGGVGAILS